MRSQTTVLTASGVVDFNGTPGHTGSVSEETSNMGYWTRSWTAVAIAVAALGTVPAAVVVFQPNGEAKADVCADVGRRVSVSGCANIADVVAPYVPPPAYYAPMPYDAPRPGGCVSYNGRWVNAGGCN